MGNPPTRRMSGRGIFYWQIQIFTKMDNFRNHQIAKSPTFIFFTLFICLFCLHNSCANKKDKRHEAQVVETIGADSSSHPPVAIQDSLDDNAVGIANMVVVDSSSYTTKYIREYNDTFDIEIRYPVLTDNVGANNLIIQNIENTIHDYKSWADDNLQLNKKLGMRFLLSIDFNVYNIGSWFSVVFRVDSGNFTVRPQTSFLTINYDMNEGVDKKLCSFINCDSINYIENAINNELKKVEPDCHFRNNSSISHYVIHQKSSRICFFLNESNTHRLCQGIPLCFPLSEMPLSSRG